MGHVVISGYLYKMKKEPRNVFQQWTRRHFSVEDFCLKWRGSPDARESGSIPLSVISAVRNFESGTKGAFSFIVESDRRTLLLRTDSAGEKDKWIRALEMQIDLVKGGSGEGIITRGERATSEKKPKTDTSLTTTIDKNLVLLNEVEKVERIRCTKDKETQNSEQDHRENYHHTSKYLSHSNDVIALGENDISRDSF